MINCMKLWISKWKENGWKTVDGEPVKGKEDLVRLDQVCSKIPVSWVTVVLKFFLVNYKRF